MSWSTEREDIEGRLDTNWSTTPIAFQNVDFDPPDNSEWVRLSILNGETVYNTLGGGLEHLGVIMMQIFSPKNIGTATVRGYADTLAGIFENAEFNDVICRAASIDNIGVVNDWYQVNVNIPYYRYE